jgi:hypothetical protein
MPWPDKRTSSAEGLERLGDRCGGRTLEFLLFAFSLPLYVLSRLGSFKANIRLDSRVDICCAVLWSRTQPVWNREEVNEAVMTFIVREQIVVWTDPLHAIHTWLVHYFLRCL